MDKVFLFGVLVGLALGGIMFFVAISPAIDTIVFDSEDVEACNGLAHQFNEMRVGIPMTNLTHRVNAGELLFHCECTTGSDAHRVHYPDVLASQNGSSVISSEIFCSPMGRH